jgi:COMPASS component SWD1
MHPLLIPSTPLTRSQYATSSSNSPTPRIRTIRFAAPVSSARFNARNSKLILVTLSSHEVLIVDLRHGEKGGKWRVEDLVEEEMEVDDDIVRRQ